MVKQFKNAIKIDVFDKHLQRSYHIFLSLIAAQCNLRDGLRHTALAHLTHCQLIRMGLWLTLLAANLYFSRGCAMQPTR